MSPPAENEARLAYRAIVWAHSCPFDHLGLSHCPYGNPGCPLMDWLLEFDARGWIDFYEGMP